jgi:hypothetical protein
METIGNFITAQCRMPCYTEPFQRAFPLGLLCRGRLLHTN